MKSKRDHALTLAAQGFRVFPLEPNGKTPAHAGVNWRKIASKDPQRVSEMWTDPVMESELDYNIGIALNAGTVVVDVDTREGKKGDKSLQLLEAIYEPVHETLEVKTASGAAHLYFKTPTPVGNSASKVGEHIDIKSEGGFVVGPGSTIDGMAYEVVRDNEIAAANDWIVQLAGAPRPRNTESGAVPLVDLDSPDSLKRATDYLTSKAPDSGTYSVAAKVKDFGVSEETCLDLMLEHWRDARGLPKDDEHIRFRVENAYRYGQNAPGIASAEAEFDAVEVDGEAGIPATKRRGLYPIRWGDAKPILDQAFLIDGLVDLGTMVVTYGDSNAGKTYVKLDQCFHIAAGRDWNGRKVRQGLVVYVAAEGGLGFLKRIEAFKRYYKVEELPFSLVPCPIDLFSEGADTNKLIALIKAEEKHFGQKCVLVVIDTLARAMAGGDENTAKDMGKFVDNVDRVRAATKATADIIHHTGKDASKGARGSSALRAATDTELEVQPGALSVAKQRDLSKSDEYRFELQTVEVGHRPDGQPVTACVVRWLETNEFDDRISQAAEGMLEVLERLIEDARDEIERDENLDEADKSNALKRVRIPWQMWQMSTLSCQKGPRGKALNRTALFPLRQELSDCGKVKKDAKNQWYI